MAISIVIPTHNRQEKLMNLLTSIREQSDKRIDSVVVVDDSDKEQDLNGFRDIGIVHIRLGHRIFISKAKNIGWRATRGEFVFFIDDDNVINDSTVSPLLETISGSDSIGAVMPAVLYKAAQQLVWVYATPFLNRRMDLNLIGRNKLRNPNFEGRMLPTDALPNASLVRRIALQDVDGFDERLVVNSSLDFSRRLKNKGWGVYSNTHAMIFHDVEIPGRLGWWAAHGSADPERVRYELRDWFLIRKSLDRDGRMFVPKSIVESLRFVLPNFLAYLARGDSRSFLLRNLVMGYIEGIRLASRPIQVSFS